MRIFPLGFFTGTLVLLVIPALPDTATLWQMAGIALALLLAVWGILRWRTLPRIWLLPLAGMVAGALYALLTATDVRDNWLPHAWEGKDVLLTGTIADVPERREDGLHFLFDADNPDFHGHLRMGWYAKEVPAVRAGERWQLQVRGKRPNGFMNPNGFDYEKWLFAQRISGSAYVRESTQNQRLDTSPWWNVDAVRQTLQEKIAAALPDSPSAGLVQGLAIACTDAVTQPQWDIFRKTGTIHLLAISGLHIGMVAMLGIIPVWLVWRSFPRLYLWLPRRIAAGMVGGLLATGYALLAGFNIPTQRTLIMLLVVLAGLFMRRRIPFGSIFGLALLLVLLLDPLAPLAVGFWLSFLAVALLVLLGGRRLRQGKGVAVWMQVSLSLGIIPLTAGFFGMVSLVSPLANLIAIPLVTFLVTPLVLLGVVLSGFWSQGAAWVWNGAAWLLDVLMQVLGWLADLPLASVYVPLFPWQWLWVAGAGFLLLWLPRGMPGRWLGALCLLPLWLYAPERPAPGAFRLAVLDVGQGLASVVETASHTLVFDTGPKSSETFDTGQLVVVPWLRGQGISHLDHLMVSHADNDHSGGAGAVLAEMPVTDISVGQSNTLPGYTVKLCERGQHWEWDGVRFTVLHPSPDYADPKDNNHSCVLKVENAAHSALLAADIERPAEQYLLREEENLHADVLLVPHHGSKSSSSAAFVDAVAPQIAIVTMGYLNRFHHPNPSVVQRYTSRRIKMFDTLHSGELMFDFPGENSGITIREWRHEQQHVWNSQGQPGMVK
jgi:competence protein ComEC